MIPAGLRERVLQASQGARAVGQAVPEVEQITAADAFARAAQDMDALLGDLDDDAWRVAVIRDLDVRGLIGHLIGVERDLHRAIVGELAVAELDHVTSTQAIAEQQRARTAAQTHADWRRAVDRTIELVSAVDPDTEIAIHTLRASLHSMLLVRTFELWTHENDIRRVLGRPETFPDSPTLALMTALAARALPLGASRIGLREPTQVRLVLTGSGGGTWDVSFGSDQPDAGAAPARVRIIAAAADFCQLAANRTTREAIALQIDGDADRADRVIDAVMALALD